MKTALVIILCLTAMGGALAQAQPLGLTCKTCVGLTDVTCTASPTNCSSTDGSETTLFTVPCTGWYYFACKTVCPEQYQCYNCITCARIELPATGQVIATCQAVLDAQFGCESSCETIPASAEVNLIADVQYRLRVQMNRCRDVPNCSYCSGCSAKARIYYAGSDCTAW